MFGEGKATKYWGVWGGDGQENTVGVGRGDSQEYIGGLRGMDMDILGVTGA